VDLYVPFCGDYEEAAAWSEDERAKYRRYLDKRKTMEAVEREGIGALLADGARPGGPPSTGPR
jgi:hypothetical protein